MITCRVLSWAFENDEEISRQPLLNALPWLKEVFTISNIMCIQPFNMEVDWPEIGRLMEVSNVLHSHMLPFYFVGQIRWQTHCFYCALFDFFCSKLTQNQDCCSALVDEATCFQCLLSILDKYPERSDITVRVCFVLGNLTARNDDCRYCLFNAPNAMEILVSVFRGYFAKDLKVSIVWPLCIKKLFSLSHIKVTIV